MNIRFFDPINIRPSIFRIYSRLGHVTNKTQVTDLQKEKLERYVSEALTLINLKGVQGRLKIERLNASVISLSDTVQIESNSLSEFLEDCKEVLFFGATSGEEIVKAISLNSRDEDLTAAVVFDAVASEMTDEALDWIMECMNSELRRENKCLTVSRFSAGYGDFSLNNQKIIYDILKMEKLGVKLTDDFLLVPEKSVTAVAGIRPIGKLD